jgi:hypothetical protein
MQRLVNDLEKKLGSFWYVWPDGCKTWKLQIYFKEDGDYYKELISS